MRYPYARFLPALAVVCTVPLITTSAPAQVVNVDSRLYGFAFPTDPAPVPGQIITPISLAPGGVLNQLTLPAGTYSISNATGLTGADPSFTGWNYSGGWVWSIVVANDATHAVVFYADRGGNRGSQASIAAQPDVQAFSGTFTLPAPATLDFMIRDYYLPDNAGGVAVLIGPACDSIDFNHDGLFPDTQDIDDFLSVFSGGACSTATCGDIDFNNDSLFPDTSDIDSLLRVFSGGSCV